ncbi:MAG TPA: RidA family protein [Polyangiaceae bacterium]|nr:RidA family protein [Polyangiaceae bacterium]HMR76918.1 RidA family protein [Polyangiaceae bacterium]
MSLKSINPPELGKPRGYSNGILAPAGYQTLSIAGQIAWNEQQQIVSEDFATQFGQALKNVIAVVQAAGGKPEHLARLTIFVRPVDDYIRDHKRVGEEYRKLMGKHYPAMALVEVKALLEPGAKVEIEATAMLPPG